MGPSQLHDCGESPPPNIERKYFHDWEHLVPIDEYLYKPKSSKLSTSSGSPSDITREPCKCLSCRLHHGMLRRHNNGSEDSHRPLEVLPRPGHITRGLPQQPGEIEQKIPVKSDWTGNWGWVLTLQAYAKPKSPLASPWVANVVITFKDLPEQLRQGGISWGDADRNRDRDFLQDDTAVVTHRSWGWVRYSEFCVRENGAYLWGYSYDATSRSAVALGLGISRAPFP